MTVTVPVPGLITSNSFMYAYHMYYNDIFKHARLYEQSSDIMQQSDTVFTDTKEKERERFEEARSTTYEDSFVKKQISTKPLLRSNVAYA